MPDAAKGVRQLVMLHGRSMAKEMVEPEAKSLVRIASEVLSDERGRSGYSYSGLCLTSLPHRKLADEQAWERTVGPLTLIIEPGRLKVGSGPSKLVGVPYGARARLILIYLQTQAVFKQRNLTGSVDARVDGADGLVCRRRDSCRPARASQAHRDLLHALLVGHHGKD